MKKKLEWKNLKDEYCPSCYCELKDLDNDKTYYISCSVCDFSISKTRYHEILEEIEKEEAGNNADNS